MIGRNRFSQSEVKQQGVCETQAGGEEKRYCNTPVAEYAADCRTKNKPQPEGCANQAHSFRPIFLGGDVGDVGLRGRYVSARNAVEDTSHEKHPERCCKAKD